MDAKDEIKARLGVEEVIGEYLELRRSGRNLKAISPFSNEKTASFMVSPEKQIWHDFSSNQGGDIFSFVMLMEGIDFRAAIEMLAPKAGVDLSQYGSGGQTAARKKKLTEIMSLAVRYYQQSLLKNDTALSYVVKQRGYGKQVIGDFEIGYAPTSGTALLNFLKKKNYSEKDIKEAGLITNSRGSWRDMFRGRIMIPLHDGHGNPIGFTARVLDDSLPKYINTPQTLLYDKSRHVFGLHLAKEAIRSQKFVVLVEGNMDVVASHKAGVKNVVATAGTAMTTEHLKQMNRLTEDVRLAFDQDKAGLAATERAIPIAQEVGVRLSIIDMQGGKDPDEMIKADPKSWERAIGKSQYVMDWLVHRYQAILDLTTAEGKKKFTDKTLAVLATIKDQVERGHYIGAIAKLVDVNVESVQAKLDGQKKTTASRKKVPKNPNIKDIKNTEPSSVYQDLLLGMNLMYPDVSDSLKGINVGLFTGESRSKLAKFVLDGVDRPYTEVPTQLQQIEDYVKLVLFKTEELYDDWSSTDRLIESVGLAHRLTHDHGTKRKLEISAAIREAEAAGDDKKKEELLRQFNALITKE